MHFLMGVLTLHESAIALAFQPLVEEERRRCDVGEKPQSLSLADCRFRKAEDRLSAENFDNATRYGIVNIRQKIIHYVASGFYPYDEIQWERFNRERETAYANALSFDTPKDEVEAIKRDLLARADATLAFLIHQTEAELGPKEHKQVRK